MKKLLQNFFLFLLFATVLYLPLLFWWGQQMEPEDKPNIKYIAGGIGNLHERLREAKEVQNIDLLFLGSSLAYRGFDVRLFQRQGLTAFNLGSSSQTPLQTRILLRRYLHRLHPKWVVYAVDPTIFSIDGVESAIDIANNDYKDGGNLRMALRLSNIKVYNTLVYSLFMDRINTPDSFHKEPNMQPDTYIAGGFVDRQLSYFGYREHGVQDWPQRGYQFRAFKDVLALLKAAGGSVILVFPPITRTLYESYSGGAAFDSTMRQWGPYYNFNKRLHLNDSLHFYDEEHLNRNGVKAFNEALIEVLKKEGILPL